jgi:hypothetical protein
MSAHCKCSGVIALLLLQRAVAPFVLSKLAHTLVLSKLAHRQNFDKTGATGLL